MTNPQAPTQAGNLKTPQLVVRFPLWVSIVVPPAPESSRRNSGAPGQIVTTR
jgi:hypothetical protein